MLYAAGRRSRVGRVDAGSTVTDYLPSERERGITIQSAAVRFEWDDHELYLIDTPGHVDFGFEVERSLGVLDGVIVVVDAVAGAQPRTVVVSKLARSRGLPVVYFVNKMDRPGANFDAALGSIKHRCGGTVVPVQEPLWTKDGAFAGARELEGRGFDVHDQDISSSSEEEDDLMGLRAMELLADVDDDAAEAFLSGDMDGVKPYLRRATSQGLASPVLCGAALRGIGVRAALDAVIDYLPPPPPPEKELNCRALAFKVTQDQHRGPLVFLRVYEGKLGPKATLVNVKSRKKERPTALLRPFADDYEPINDVATNGEIIVAVGLKATVAGDTLVDDTTDVSDDFMVLKDGMIPPAPVFAQSVEPDRAADFEMLKSALEVLTRDDPSLVAEIQNDSVVLAGMGELHLDIARDRLRRDFSVSCTFGKPRVEYRESIESSVAHDSLLVYDRTIGSKRLHFGIQLFVTPAGGGGGGDHRNGTPPRVTIHPEAQDKLRRRDPNLELAITAGLLSTRGPKEGHPLADLFIDVLDVAVFDDPTPGAARASAVDALNDLLQTSTVILEPVMRLNLSVPDARVGDVLADLALKRGSAVLAVNTSSSSQDTTESTSRVDAFVPLAELLGYATAVRSLTAGEADFSTDYSHHAVRS